MRKLPTVAVPGALLSGLLVAIAVAGPPGDENKGQPQPAKVAKQAGGVARDTQPATKGKPVSVGAEAGTAAAPNITVFTDLQDAAFDRYVDLQLLGAAWLSLDAADLTDAGLQLAEGERILLRPHKAVSARKVLDAAVRVAATTGDKDSLDRLAKAADRLGDKDLAARVKEAQTLVGSARPAADPDSLVSPDEITPEALATYQEFIAAINLAKLSGDRKNLKEIEAEIPGLTELGPKPIAYLKRLCTEALAAIPEKPDPLQEILGKLADGSRGPHPPVHQKGKFQVKGPIHKGPTPHVTKPQFGKGPTHVMKGSIHHPPTPHSHHVVAGVHHNGHHHHLNPHWPYWWKWSAFPAGWTGCVVVPEFVEAYSLEVPAVAQDRRYLKIGNLTPEPITVHVKYYTINEDNGWVWVPSNPDDDNWSGPFTIQPGQYTHLIDQGFLVNGNRVRIYAESPSGARWTDYADNDLWLVELNSRGERIYYAPEMETFVYRFTTAAAE